MMPQSILQTALLDLHYELRDTGVVLLLGGGYGLYLKQLQLQNLREPPRTILRGEVWPVPRSTEDLDLFLSTDIVTDVGQMRAIRAALDRLGYQVIEAAKFFQFAKPIGTAGRVKIDFLTGPISDAATANKIHRNLPRVRSRARVELHAYLTEEALDLHENPMIIELTAVLSTGDAHTATVYVPQPFTFLLMKLHAFAYRVDDTDKDLGRHHALDIYRLVAMMTESEYQHALGLAAKYRGHKAMARATAIVHDHFASDTSRGILRLREHSLYDPKFDQNAMIQVLAEIFPPP